MTPAKAGHQDWWQSWNCWSPVPDKMNVDRCVLASWIQSCQENETSIEFNSLLRDANEHRSADTNAFPARRGPGAPGCPARGWAYCRTVPRLLAKGKVLHWRWELQGTWSWSNHSPSGVKKALWSPKPSPADQGCSKSQPAVVSCLCLLKLLRSEHGCARPGPVDPPVHCQLFTCFALAGGGPTAAGYFPKRLPTGSGQWQVLAGDGRKRKGEARKCLLPSSPCPGGTNWSQFVQVSPGFSIERPTSLEPPLPDPRLSAPSGFSPRWLQRLLEGPALPCPREGWPPSPPRFWLPQAALPPQHAPLPRPSASLPPLRMLSLLLRPSAFSARPSPVSPVPSWPTVVDT